MNKKNKAFTLIELIVVMTIIMVVTMVGVVSFSGVSKKARDGRRQADLEKLRMALESVKQVGGTYPVATGLVSTALTGLVPTYMPSLPKSPKSDDSYYYDGTAYSYQLSAAMEDLGSTTGAYGSNCGKACNYQITNF